MEITMSKERVIRIMQENIIKANKKDFLIKKNGYMGEGCYCSTFSNILAYKWVDMKVPKHFLWFKWIEILQKRKKLFKIDTYDNFFEINVWYDEYLSYIKKNIIPVLKKFKGYNIKIKLVD